MRQYKTLTGRIKLSTASHDINGHKIPYDFCIHANSPENVAIYDTLAMHVVGGDYAQADWNRAARKIKNFVNEFGGYYGADIYVKIR